MLRTTFIFVSYYSILKWRPHWRYTMCWENWTCSLEVFILTLLIHQDLTQRVKQYKDTGQEFYIVQEYLHAFSTRCLYSR